MRELHELTFVYFPLYKGVSSEKELVKGKNAKYSRLYVTDHCRPRDSQVDLFVSLVRKYVSQKKNM